MIININNPPLHTVEISRQGENEFRAIEIDVSEWLAEYPDGKISVIYCRPDGELYPVIVGATESPITWRPTATDTAVSGVGAIEVRIQIGDVLGKSCTIESNVLGALGAPGDTPAAPAPDWTRTVTEDADRAEAAADKAEAASTHMPQISTSKTWLVWDANKGEYVDTGVSAAGAKGDDGDPGKAPIIGSNGNWYVWDDASGAYADTGKPSRGEKGAIGAAGADGADGKDGANGITPTIGENGNWYLGDTDTGKPSRGKDGATGATGEKGADGKSAYAYAVDGGYTGTEEEFAAKLAQEKFSNPNALTFTGAVTGSYDGSAPLSVEIPSGGGSSGGSTAEWQLLGTYTMLVSDRVLTIDLSQFEGITHFRIIGNFPKCSENCGSTYLYLGTKLNHTREPKNSQNVYAFRLLAECELVDGQLYGFIGTIDGWNLQVPASVVINTPRDSGKCTSFRIYYANAVNDTTENTIQIWGY